MDSGINTRREFLRISGSVLATSALASHISGLQAFGKIAQLAHKNEAAYENIDSTLAANIEAICEQIIPADEYPGAKDAGVIYFIDKAWVTLIGSDSVIITDGVAEISQQVKTDTRSNQQYSDLSFDLQKAILSKLDTRPFFEIIHFWTIAGLFSMPKYGGNKNQLGWKLLGFDHRHAWLPPFGYYDKQYRQGNLT